MSQNDFPTGMAHICMESTLWDFAFNNESLSLRNFRVNEMEPMTAASTMVASNIPNHGTIEITRIRRG
ncbi:MAG: hypothetical protein VXW13_02885 [SAR324 cluster bacterium]|nr:hypothetical protein [SAR324 cluster bacterium]